MVLKTTRAIFSAATEQAINSVEPAYLESTFGYAEMNKYQRNSLKVCSIVTEFADSILTSINELMAHGNLIKAESCMLAAQSMTMGYIAADKSGFTISEQRKIKSFFSRARSNMQKARRKTRQGWLDDKILATLEQLSLAVVVNNANTSPKITEAAVRNTQIPLKQAMLTSRKFIECI